LAESAAQMCAPRAKRIDFWLRRTTEADVKEAQMCAQALIGERGPRRAAVVLAAAFRKARHEARRWIPPSECFGRIAQHCVQVWAVETGAKSIGAGGEAAQPPIITSWRDDLLRG